MSPSSTTELKAPSMKLNAQLGFCYKSKYYLFHQGHSKSFKHNTESIAQMVEQKIVTRQPRVQSRLCQVVVEVLKDEILPT